MSQHTSVSVVTLAKTMTPHSVVQVNVTSKLYHGYICHISANSTFYGFELDTRMTKT